MKCVNCSHTSESIVKLKFKILAFSEAHPLSFGPKARGLRFHKIYYMHDLIILENSTQQISIAQYDKSSKRISAIILSFVL